MGIPSRNLTSQDASIVKALLGAGWIQSDIASLMGVNGGRISEINTGATFASVSPANVTDPWCRAYLLELHLAWVARISSQLKVSI